MSGKEPLFVACTCIVDEPLAERMAVGVAASENMSVMWALKSQLLRTPQTLSRRQVLIWTDEEEEIAPKLSWRMLARWE